MKLIIIALVTGLLTQWSVAQVLIAPTAAYLGDRASSTTLQIMNPSAEDREVELRLEFGYPTSDSVGMTTIQYQDSLAADQFSCAGWVTVFPRKFLLKAGTRQTVRLTARTPQGLEEGVYWARLVTTTKVIANVGSDDTTTNVGARLAFNYNQVIPLTFRHGDPQLSVSSPGLASTQFDGRSVPILPLAVIGKGAFVGSITCVATPAAGGEERTIAIPTSVYFRANKRIGEPLAALEPGDYHLRVTISSEKEGTSSELIAEIQPVVLENDIRIDERGNITIR